MNPPDNDDLTLPNAIVLFADLLGFSHQVEKVRSLEDAAALTAKLDRFAREFSESHEMAAFFGKKYWAFSDSIVVAWYEKSEAAVVMTPFDAQLHQLSGIAFAQAMSMQQDGQLVRGGIGRGWLLERDETVVGQALVSAARLEKLVKSPFIAVETSLYEHFVGHPGRRMYAPSIDPIPSTFIAPCDYTHHLPALDYLMVALGEMDLSTRQIHQARDIPPGEARDAFMSLSAWNNKLEFVRWHRDFIAKGLETSDKRTLEKYEALRAHHNYRVTSAISDDPALVL